MPLKLKHTFKKCIIKIMKWLGHNHNFTNVSSVFAYHNHNF